MFYEPFSNNASVGGPHGNSLNLSKYDTISNHVNVTGFKIPDGNDYGAAGGGALGDAPGPAGARSERVPLCRRRARHVAERRLPHAHGLGERGVRAVLQ